MKIEINSLEELVAFVALIRGETLESEKILEMTNRLQTSTAALANAEEADKKGKSQNPPPPPSDVGGLARRGI